VDDDQQQLDRFVQHHLGLLNNDVYELHQYFNRSNIRLGFAALQNNSDVWVGWTFCAAGPAWEADYIYLIKPFKNVTIRNRLMPTLEKFYVRRATPIPKPNDLSRPQCTCQLSLRLRLPTPASCSFPASSTSSSERS
jgi:hypothetical protein